MIWKSRFIAQWFSQRCKIDFYETYSNVVDASNFLYLVSLVAHKGLNLNLTDIVTSYLYGSLDSDIYMSLHEEFNIPEALFWILRKLLH